MLALALASCCHGWETVFHGRLLILQVLGTALLTAFFSDYLSEELGIAKGTGGWTVVPAIRGQGVCALCHTDSVFLQEKL